MILGKYDSVIHILFVLNLKVVDWCDRGGHEKDHGTGHEKLCIRIQGYGGVENESG